MPMPSYADRDVQYPMRFQLVKVSGTEDQFDLIPVPGTINNAGTQLNKSFFDAVKAAIEEMAVADGGITTAKLANGAVTAAKLAALAVGTSIIQNGAITSEKLASNALFVIDTYTGAGGSSKKDINLEFKPRFVVVLGENEICLIISEQSGGHNLSIVTNIDDETAVSEEMSCYINSTGFTIRHSFNEAKEYKYIAFR